METEHKFIMQVVVEVGNKRRSLAGNSEEKIHEQFLYYLIIKKEIIQFISLEYSSFHKRYLLSREKDGGGER